MKICKEPSCMKPIRARGLCVAHYKAQRLSGALETRIAPAGRDAGWIQRHASYSSDDCLLWPYRVDRDGYGVASSNVCRRASRLMCIEAHGEPENGQQAAHSCHNRLCVNPRHLRWATARENASDRTLIGNTFREADSPLAKLTRQQAREIFAETRKRSNAAIAKDFGVSPATVSNIRARKSWTTATSERAI